MGTSAAEAKISLIVPVYNVEKYLATCVHSLLLQSLSELQILLIDDGSEDSSAEICDEFARKDERVEVFHFENHGQSFARNRGLEHARAPYIMFVDSDDFISLDACETFYRAAEETGADVVWGDYAEVAMSPSFNCTGKLVSGLDYLKEAFEQDAYNITPCLQIYRRDYIEKNKLRFPEGYIYEDQPWNLKMFLAPGAKFLRIDLPFYHYRMGIVSTTSFLEGDKLKKLRTFSEVIHQMIDYVEQNITNPEEREYASSYIANSIYIFSLPFAAYLSQEEQEELERTAIDDKMRQYAHNSQHLEKKKAFWNERFYESPTGMARMFMEDRGAPLEEGETLLDLRKWNELFPSIASGSAGKAVQSAMVDIKVLNGGDASFEITGVSDVHASVQELPAWDHGKSVECFGKEAEIRIIPDSDGLLVLRLRTNSKHREKSTKVFFMTEYTHLSVERLSPTDSSSATESETPENLIDFPRAVYFGRPFYHYQKCKAGEELLIKMTWNPDWYVDYLNDSTHGLARMLLSLQDSAKAIEKLSQEVN